MRIYVAAPFAARELARGVGEALIKEGHIITSRWFHSTRIIDDTTIGTAQFSTPEEVRTHALQDLEEVASSTALVMLTSSYAGLYGGLPDDILDTGGRHVEMGYALAHRIPVYLLGEPENIFNRSLIVGSYGSVADLLRELY